MSVECGGFHQSYHDEVGRPVLKRIVYLEHPFCGGQVVGPHFTTHCGITDHLARHGFAQGSLEVLVDLHLAQQQFDLYVRHVQPQQIRTSIPHGEEVGGVEEQLDAYLHLGHQELAHVKHLDHGLEAQHVRLVHVLGVFLSHGLEGLALGFGQRRVIRVDHVRLVGRQLSDGRIQTVHPPLRFQDGLAVVSVEIERRVYHGLVGVGVRLGTDERVVEPDADLLEEGVGEIVDQQDLGGVGGRQLGGVRFLQFQFEFEFALTQIDVFRLGIDLKVHGIDAGREGVDGHLATIHDAEVGGGHLEQIQRGRHDGFGTRDDGDRTHGAVVVVVVVGVVRETRRNMK